MTPGERAAQLVWLDPHGIRYTAADDRTLITANDLDTLIRMADYMGGECEWFALCTEPAETLAAPPRARGRAGV